MSGRQLSSFIDDAGKPICGIRTEVPTASTLWICHEKQDWWTGLKKHVELDDYNGAIYLQLRLNEG